MVITFRCISFVKGDPEKGHYFYNAPYNADYGHIYAVQDLTLDKAITILKSKGIDVINDFKMSIFCYYKL